MGSGTSGIECALQLAQWGYNTLPARYQGKAPVLDWRKYQLERTDHKIRAWFSGSSPKNYWVLTGAISRVVVLDMDSIEAEAWWRAIPGMAELMDATTCVQTSKGHHYHFRLPEGVTTPTWSVHKDENAGGVSFDVRGEGSGVIVPPSVHESGHVYAWLDGRDPSVMVTLDPERLSEARERATETLGAGGGVTGAGESGTVVRSLLTALLSKPGEGGYNVWFTKVCGHYAKQYRDQRDAYEYHCWEAYEKLRFPGSEPHPKKDASKTLESVWRKEHSKVEAGAGQVGPDGQVMPQPDPDNGWLVGTGAAILTQTRTKRTGQDGKEFYDLGLDEWADFDIRAIGVVEDTDARRTYDVEIVRKRHGDIRSGLLKAGVLSDSRQLAAWLAEFGVFVSPPDAMYPRNPGVTVRLGKYLESQNPPQFRVVDYLGWHTEKIWAGGEAQDGPGGFLTHEGVITGDGGLQPHRGVKPHPQLRNWAPYRYGFEGGQQRAREVLREVLTFHDETVCSVFGAWWAACLLKPQIHQVSSQFPFMALEASSGSGKSTGYFSLMLALAGNTQGNMNPTKAALRDYISANQSGIVWIDDLDDPDHLMELLRGATVEGSVSKKDEDKTSQKTVRLVAPILLSGEALKISGQKALADRAILLGVSDPSGRKSVKPGRGHLPQWADIVALKQQHPDLSVFAGSLVQMALQHAGLVDRLPELTGASGGRFGDKIGVLRLGAVLLAAMTGDSEHIDRVDAWCSEQVDTGAHNALTLELIPTALAQTGWRSNPTAATGRWPITPVLVSDDLVWFSPSHLAIWWEAFKNGHVEPRTESVQALIQQARALGLGGSVGGGRRRFDIDHDRNRKTVYWSLGEWSEQVLIKSKGDSPRMSPGVSQHGVYEPQQDPLPLSGLDEMRLALQAFTSPSQFEEPFE